MGNRLLPNGVNVGSVGVALGGGIGKFKAHQLPLELFNARGTGDKKYWAESPPPKGIWAGVRAIFLPRLSKKVESVVLSPS